MRTKSTAGAGAPPNTYARASRKFRQTENEDAAIFTLVMQLRKLNGRWGAALEAIAEAQERAVAPPPPESLRRRDGDEILPIAFHPRRNGHFEDQAIAQARNFLAANRRKRSFWRGEVALRIQTRFREIIAAAEAWEQAKRRAFRDSGELAADRAATRIGEARARLYAELGRTPARTAAGVIAKISVAAYDVDVFRDDFAESREIEHVLASSVLDAVALIGDSAVAFCKKSATAFTSEIRAHITGEAAP